MKRRLISTGVAVSILVAVSPALSEEPVVELRLWEGVDGFVVQPGEARVEVRGEGDRIDRWTVGLRDPLMTVYRPEPVDPRAIGAVASGPAYASSLSAACLCFPGGGYGGLSRDKEGHWVAKWMAERGVVGVAVDYRCGEGNPHPAPLADAQRAIRLVRENAAEWGVDPERVGVMGFSAGGHLAASAATMWRDRLEGVNDPLAGVSARPDFAVLVYPVVSFRKEVTHGGSRINLLMGPDPDESLIAKLSTDERVDAETPPTFLVHTADDPVVPVANPQRFFDACREHGVPTEMHLYEKGGHGYGMWTEEKGSLATWPAVLQRWLSSRGVITSR